MKKVIILSGISGSGKSTYIENYKVEPFVVSTSVSADYFFYKDGEYKFDAAKLGEAHADCFRKFILNITQDFKSGVNSLVFVDNTNLTVAEIAPYYLGAQAFGYEPEIVTILTSIFRDVELIQCAERNKHGVSFDGIRAQARRLFERGLPPWYKNTNIAANSFAAMNSPIF